MTKRSVFEKTKKNETNVSKQPRNRYGIRQRSVIVMKPCLLIPKYLQLAAAALRLSNSIKCPSLHQRNAININSKRIISIGNFVPYLRSLMTHSRRKN